MTDRTRTGIWTLVTPVAKLGALEPGGNVGIVDRVMDRWDRWRYRDFYAMQERGRAEDDRRYQILQFGVEMRRLAQEAGMDMEEWLDSPACQAYMEGLTPLGLEAVEYQRELVERRREAAERAWNPEEGSAGKTPYPASLQPIRDAEAKAQAFLETFRSELTAPTALAMATALAKRGKLDDTNMRRAEELYEQRAKSASADYWPTAESVVALLFGRLPG